MPFAGAAATEATAVPCSLSAAGRATARFSAVVAGRACELRVREVDAGVDHRQRLPGPGASALSAPIHVHATDSVGTSGSLTAVARSVERG